MFTEKELEDLIQNTDFKTINSAMIKLCNGTEDDYCDGPPLPDGTRLKCCVGSVSNPF